MIANHYTAAYQIEPLHYADIGSGYWQRILNDETQ